jgi:hypothetical protein
VTLSLREQLELERAKLATTETYVRKRGDAIRELEECLAVSKARCAGLEQEVQQLRARPAVEVPRQRRELPVVRKSKTFTLRVGSKTDGVSCTLCLGFYDDGGLGEVFFRGNRNARGGSVGSFGDAWATDFSYALQHGLSVWWMLGKARYLADGSGGIPFVRNGDRYEVHPTIHHVSSLIDYVAAVIERILMGKPGTKTTPEEQKAIDAAKREAA